MASSLTHLHPQYPFQEPASKSHQSILIDLDQAGWIFTRSTITGTVTITYDENERKNYESFIEANTPLLHILGEEKVSSIAFF